jgi:hypothetical protein
MVLHFERQEIGRHGLQRTLIYIPIVPDGVKQAH